MAKKRLQLRDIEVMKNMVIKGIAPEDIAKHFNVAISSVHNYKTRFKQEGLNFPNVRGKRPTGSITTFGDDVKMSNDNRFIPVIDTHVVDQSSSMNFVVNGIRVHVSTGAKNVNITKDSIEVNF
jgi:hypothetical protein